jgi:mannose-6-phosphate isomerase-like protein (cupin superfamily)
MEAGPFRRAGLAFFPMRDEPQAHEARPPIEVAGDRTAMPASAAEVTDVRTDAKPIRGCSRRHTMSSGLSYGGWFLRAAFVVLLGAPVAVTAQQPDYEKATHGTRILEAQGGLAIRMLVEASNLGSGEVEIGEITIPAGSGAARQGHRHGAIEIFYILSGELDHIVNGESHLLKPGDVGIVRPGDSVVHRVPGTEPVKALVIWAPGGEADRIAPGMQQRPIRSGG